MSTERTKTATQKALDLVKIFQPNSYGADRKQIVLTAKIIAGNCCDQMIEDYRLANRSNTNIHNWASRGIEYWEEVKKEVEKLSTI